MVEPSLSGPTRTFLPTAMRVYGVLFALTPASFYWIPAAGRWEPYNVSYERMFTVLFFAWGICLFWAADSPSENRAIVRFSALQGILHGGRCSTTRLPCRTTSATLAGMSSFTSRPDWYSGLGAVGSRRNRGRCFPTELALLVGSDSWSLQ